MTLATQAQTFRKRYGTLSAAARAVDPDCQIYSGPLHGKPFLQINFTDGSIVKKFLSPPLPLPLPARLTLNGPQRTLAAQVADTPHSHHSLPLASQALDASARIHTGIYLGKPWTQVYFSDGSFVRLIDDRVYVNGELQ